MGMIYRIKKIVSALLKAVFCCGALACAYVSLEGIFWGVMVLTMPLVYALLFGTIVAGIAWAVFTDSLEKRTPVSTTSGCLTEAQAQKIFG